MKKIISVVLVALMLVSSLPFGVSAAEKSDYIPLYDKDTPVVLLHGIGQNDTYLIDEEGNRMYDDEGDEITGWPLEIDIWALVKKVVPNLLFSAVTRKNAGLTDKVREGVYDLLWAIHKDNEGNYEYNIEVPSFKGPMSQMPEDLKEMYYNRMPMHNLKPIVGEENMYVFGYDSLGDIEKTTQLLHEFITETVLPNSKSEKVNICPISLGGTLAVSYLGMYPEDYRYIKNMVYVVPAIDGSDIVGDILTGNLSTSDNDMLYNKLMVALMGDNYTAYLINMLLRVLLPEQLLKDVVSALGEGVVEAAILNCTQLWALCPTRHYTEAREKWLADGEHDIIAKKVDTYMQSRANFEENQNKLIAGGSKVYDIVCYGLELYPLTKDYASTNSDGIIQSASTSMGATFAPLGETLGENYKAAGAYCKNASHNHLSPDGTVDPTTGLLPCTTWYFEGQSHEALQYNDVCLDLAIELMTDDNMTDVYSNPEAYPQYNSHRSTRNTDRMIRDYKSADKKNISAENIEKLESAVAVCESLKNETVIDSEKWEKAEDNLYNAMIDAGLREKEKTNVIEVAFTRITKKLNEAMGKILP